MQPTANKELEAMRTEIEKQVAEYLAGGGTIYHAQIGEMADPAPKPKGGKKAKELTRQEAQRLYKVYTSSDMKMQDVADMAGMGRTCLKKNWLKYGLLYNHSDRNNKG